MLIALLMVPCLPLTADGETPGYAIDDFTSGGSALPVTDTTADGTPSISEELNLDPARVVSGNRTVAVNLSSVPEPPSGEAAEVSASIDPTGLGTITFTVPDGCTGDTSVSYAHNYFDLLGGGTTDRIVVKASGFENLRATFTRNGLYHRIMDVPVYDGTAVFPLDPAAFTDGPPALSSFLGVSDLVFGSVSPLGPGTYQIHDISVTTSQGEPKLKVVNRSAHSLSLAFEDLPSGQEFHLRRSAELGQFHLLEPYLDFNYATGLPLVVPIDFASSPSTFLSAFPDTSYLWLTETVDAEDDVGGHPSLAYGPDGRPAIAYHDNTDNRLKFARLGESGWTIQTLDPTTVVAGYISLAFGPDGRPAISYSPYIRQLKFARETATGWDITVVDNRQAVGDYSSLAFGPDGHPAISYSDSADQTLEFARFDGTAWVKTTVDHSGKFTIWTSLAFGPDGHPAISYWEHTGFNLKFARFDGQSWNLTTVDSPGAVGAWTSLAFGPDGYPAISYYDLGNEDLKFARENDTGWQITTVDGLERVGSHSSLSFGPDGQPAIAYFNYSRGDIVYAQFTGTEWLFDTIDVDGDGSYCTLAFGPDGQPAAAYKDDTNTRLKFARRVESPGN